MSDLNVYLDQFLSVIQRNIDGWPTPDDIEATEDPVERLKLQRCNAFARGALVFYAFMECKTCESIYDITDFPVFKFPDEDTEQSTMACPGCLQQNIVVLRVSAMHMPEGKPLPYRKLVLQQSLDKDAKPEYKLSEFEPADYSEEVQLIGFHQVARRFLQVAMSTPLILLNIVELIKQQPGLVYNIFYVLPDFAAAICNMRQWAVGVLGLADVSIYSSLGSTRSLHEFVSREQRMEPDIQIEPAEEEEGYVQLKGEDFEPEPPKPAYVVVWHNWRSMRSSVANELRASGQKVDTSQERHDYTIEAFVLKDGRREVVESIRVAKVGLNSNLEPVRKALFGLLDIMVASRSYSLVKVFTPLDEAITDLVLLGESDRDAIRYFSVLEYSCKKLVPELCKDGLPLTQAKEVLLQVYAPESGDEFECPVCLLKFLTVYRQLCANCGIVSNWFGGKGRTIDWDDSLGVPFSERQEEREEEKATKTEEPKPQVVETRPTETQCDYCDMIQFAGPLRLGFCECHLVPENKLNYRARFYLAMETKIKEGLTFGPAFDAVLEEMYPQTKTQQVIAGKMKADRDLLEPKQEVAQAGPVFDKQGNQIRAMTPQEGYKMFFEAEQTTKAQKEVEGVAQAIEKLDLKENYSS